jgi:hypothetical protein
LVQDLGRREKDVGWLALQAPPGKDDLIFANCARTIVPGAGEAFSPCLEVGRPPEQFAIANRTAHPGANEILATPEPLSLHQLLANSSRRCCTEQRTDFQGASAVCSERRIDRPRHAEGLRELVLEQFDPRVNGDRLHPWSTPIASPMRIIPGR